MEQPSLLKVLTSAGFGSRRQAAEIIKSGRVTVNGRLVDGYGFPVKPETDIICVDGKKMGIKPTAPVYLVLNKPEGVLATTLDDRGRSTVMDFVPEKYRNVRLFPAGRLDRDSTGLVLLTNDGELAYRLSHPRFECEKEYHITTGRQLEPGDLAALQSGLMLADGPTRPAGAGLLDQATNTYTVIIHEGRNHIVRRMLAHLGYLVTSLKRVRIGPVALGRLKPGQTRVLTPFELRQLERFR